MNAPDNLVADAAHRLFGARGEELSPAFWRELSETGLHQVLALGGETAFHDAVSVLRAAGYHAVAAPIAEAVLAEWLAARAGWPGEAGVATVSFGADPFERTPWGRDAVALYTVASTRILRLDTAGAKIDHGRNLAGEPRDRVSFALAKPQRSEQAVDADEAFAVAALLRAAQMAGAMERSLELAIEHANTRVQFGKQIGKFQAIQQMLAQLAAHAAAAAAAVDLGADAFAAGDGQLEAAIAKSRAGEAAGFAAEISHQVIGAMGFTLEHPLHRYTRRLWSWRDEYGNEAYWNARIGDAALRAGTGGTWPLIADRPWLRYEGAA